MPEINLEQWGFDSTTKRVTPNRRAEFWQAGDGGSVDCSLCYRKCHLADGESGWCKYRHNQNGEMVIPDHGMLARYQRQILAYGGGFSTFHPGALSMGIGSTRCTAHCTYCTSGNIIWNPEKMKWANKDNIPRAPGNDRGWYQYLGFIHPIGAIKHAKRARCTHIAFSENEPLLSWEYTFDVARLAKEEGMRVLIYTNGFSEPEAIRRLAPYVDAVDVGVKGSLSERFYTKWMNAPGAPEIVKRSILEWKNLVPHVIVSDLIATQIQQSDEEFETEATALYKWIHGVDPHTVVMQAYLHFPDTHPKAEEAMLPPLPHLHSDYEMRWVKAWEIARRGVGLPYAFLMHNDWVISCHNCGGALLRVFRWPDRCKHTPCQMHTFYCTCWTHEQHVTNGCCNHCGASVPVETLTTEELQTARTNAAYLETMRHLAFPSTWGIR